MWRVGSSHTRRDSCTTNKYLACEPFLYSEYLSNTGLLYTDYTIATQKISKLQAKLTKICYIDLSVNHSTFLAFALANFSGRLKKGIITRENLSVKPQPQIETITTPEIAMRVCKQIAVYPGNGSMPP